MANALFGFEHADRGERAAASLLDAGLPPSAISVHTNSSIEKHSTVRAVDEQVTGGLLTNMRDLFQGIFEWGSSPHDGSVYEEILRRGGTVIDVTVRDRMQLSRVDMLMQSAGCSRRTDWQEPGRTDKEAA
jgi:hypothetical protein